MTSITVPTILAEVANAATKNGFNVEPDNLQIQSLEDLRDDSQLSGVLNNKSFSSIFALIRDFAALDDQLKVDFIQFMVEIIEKVTSSLPNELCTEAKDHHIKLLFFFQHLCLKAESSFSSSPAKVAELSKAKGKKSKKSTTSDSTFESFWLSYRSECLSLLNEVVSMDLSSFFRMGLVQENLLTPAWQFPLSLLCERPLGITGAGHKEVANRALCQQIIGKTISHFSGSNGAGSTGTDSNVSNFCASVGAALLDGMMRYEHMASVAVEICGVKNITASFTEDLALGYELMGEIGRMNFALVPASGVKNVSLFVETYARANPASMVRCFPVIVKQLDSSAHQVRSAVLQTMGHIIVHAAKQMDKQADQAETGLSTNEQDRNLSSLLRMREALLDVLIERAHDVSPYTRAALLRTWEYLLLNGAVPLKRLASVGEVAVDRLVDRNFLVRRHALALLSLLVEHNPFSVSLDSAVFQKQHEVLSAQLKQKLDELTLVVSKPLEGKTGTIAPIQEEGESILEEGTGALQEEDEEADDADEEAAERPEEDSETRALRAKLDYCSTALEVIKIVQDAVPGVTQLLRSKIATDVTETLNFLTRAINFRVRDALSVFSSAFVLIWHQDVSVRSALLKAFSSVYLSAGDGAEEGAKLPVSEILDNLCRLIRQSTVTSAASLEQIVGLLFQGDSYLSVFSLSDVAEALWMRIRQQYQDAEAPTLVSGETSDLASSIKILTMIAKALPVESLDVVLPPAALQLVVLAALTKRVEGGYDAGAVRSACACMVVRPSIVEDSGELTQVYEEAVPLLIEVIIGSASCDDLQESSVRSWFGMCEEAMHALCRLHPRPDQALSAVLHCLSVRLLTEKKAAAGGVGRLARMIFALGQTALCSLVLVEDVAALAKRVKKTTPRVSGASVGGVDCEEGVEGEGSDAMEREMGLAAAQDAEHEQTLLNLIENELVQKNLLGRFLALVRFVAADAQGSFSHPMLREVSTLSLCRMMSVSASVCEESLPLLFTLLQREGCSDHVRTTIIIALGDMAVRFPNAVEPWTAHLYSRLTDDSAVVRYNALMVLTHLVLNDMIKVKGQVSQVARSLNDECGAVKDLARLLFIRLAERSNNPVYNLLGDIIGALSRGSTDSEEDGGRELTEAQFQSTMQFLLSFVQKDRQADTLLERLLARLSQATSVKQRRHIAFCIAQLGVSDKGLRKAVELFRTVKDAIYDAEVRKCFVQLASKAKKVSSVPATSNTTTTANVGAPINPAEGATIAPTSAEARAARSSAAEELESLIMGVERAASGEEEVEGVASAEVVPKKTRAAPKKGKASNAKTARTRGKKIQQVVSDEDSLGSESDIENSDCSDAENIRQVATKSRRSYAEIDEI